MKKLIVLGAYIAWSLPSSSFAACNQVSDMTFEAIAARIKPVGIIESQEGIVAAPAEKKALSANAGQERYKSTCSLCHESGVGGAPKFRNEADWKPRVAAGMDEMLKIAIQGKGGMPPKGTCMDCSDEELRKAIEYMIPQK